MISIPGIIVSKTAFVNDTGTVAFTYPAQTNTNKKANAVLIYFVAGTGVYVSLDGATASATNGIGLSATMPYIIVGGTPTIKSVGTGATVDVYLIDSPAFGR